MANVKSKISKSLIIALYGTGQLLSMALAFPKEVRRWAYYGASNYSSYRNSVYYLKRKGLVEFSTKEGRRFLKLTRKGELAALLAKAKLPAGGAWDGKWRIIIFDIPEQAKAERDHFRWLLKQNNFVKLQASVYINPFALNREAVRYLNQTGLIKFIRIFRVDNVDNDQELRKKFGLK